MAKDFKKGDDYLAYINTGSQGTPTWELVPAIVNINIDPQPSDIVIQEAALSDGHMNGLGDPQITFTMQNDKGDANVADIIAALTSGALTELAFADGPIATVGTIYYRLESCLRGGLSAQRGEAASYDVTANRHVNSVADLTRVVAT